MSSKSYILITLTVLFIVSSFEVTSQWAIDDSGCRTPDRGVGTCIVIRECQTMIDFLEKATTITPSLVRILRNYQCGFEGKTVKVCCPDSPINIKLPNEPPVPVVPSIPTSPDVTNHRNINLLPLIENCGLLPSKNRIINGNKTALSEFPWMTLLSYQTRTGPDFRCGGTLINERYILTAAHCISNLDNLSLLGVRLGEYNISSVLDCEKEGKDVLVCAEPVQDIEIEEVIPHPNYNVTTYSNDIGLLRLRSPAQLKPNVKPICLPTMEVQRNKNFINSKLIVTGWGSTGSTSRRSEDLLKVELPVIAEADCKAAYNQTPAVINHKQLCAGGKNKRDSCGGDSGGPIQSVEVVDDDIHFVQYGIVSFGPRNCGLEGFPGVYTRIDFFMDWILDNMHA